MTPNWVDVSTISFNTILLLESVQLSWFPSWLPENEMAVALRANPTVEWFMRHKCPQINPWIDKIMARNVPPATPEEIRQSEIHVLEKIQDLLIYALDPSIYDNLPFLAWDSGELTSIAEFKDKVVLDIGSGTGRLTWVAADKARVVFAVEPVGNLRDTVRCKAREKRHNNVFPVDGVITSIPFPDQFADITMAGHVFGNAPEAEYQEMLRVTRPNGLLILCPGNNDLDNDTHRFLLSKGFRWSRYEEPQSGFVRKYWKYV